MANITFPSNPVDGQKVTVGKLQFEYDSTTQRWSASRLQILGTLSGGDFTIDAPNLGVSINSISFTGNGETIDVTYTYTGDVSVKMVKANLSSSNATLYTTNNTITVTSGPDEFSGGTINLIATNGRQQEVEVINVSMTILSGIYPTGNEEYPSGMTPDSSYFDQKQSCWAMDPTTGRFIVLWKDNSNSAPTKYAVYALAGTMNSDGSTTWSTSSPLRWEATTTSPYNYWIDNSRAHVLQAHWAGTGEGWFNISVTWTMSTGVERLSVYPVVVSATGAITKYTRKYFTTDTTNFPNSSYHYAQTLVDGKVIYTWKNNNDQTRTNCCIAQRTSASGFTFGSLWQADIDTTEVLPGAYTNNTPVEFAYDSTNQKILMSFSGYGSNETLFRIGTMTGNDLDFTPAFSVGSTLVSGYTFTPDPSPLKQFYQRQLEFHPPTGNFLLIGYSTDQDKVIGHIGQIDNVANTFSINFGANTDLTPYTYYYNDWSTNASYNAGQALYTAGGGSEGQLAYNETTGNIGWAFKKWNSNDTSAVNGQYLNVTEIAVGEASLTLSVPKETHDFGYANDPALSANASLGTDGFNWFRLQYSNTHNYYGAMSFVASTLTSGYNKPFVFTVRAVK